MTPIATLPGYMLADILRRVLPHASKDKMLPLLNSVRLTRDSHTTELVAWATDRFTLARAGVHVEASADSHSWGVTVRADDARAVVRMFERVRSLVTIVAEGGRVRFVDDGTYAYTVDIVEGNYPSLQPLLDREVGEPGGMVALKPANLEKFASRHLVSKVDAVSKTWPLRFEYGESGKPVRVRFGDSFEALVMPVRMEGGA